MSLSRRGFIMAGVLAGGGLAIGAGAAAWRFDRNPRKPHGNPPPPAPGEVNAWLTIDPEGIVTVRSPFSELGQGSMTSVAMLAAEELDVPWQDVRVSFADPHRQVNQGEEYGTMRTSASIVVRGTHEAILQAGASARERLRHAAAAAWGVDPQAVTAAGGRLTADGKDASYGEFATAAGTVSLSSEPALKSPDQWRLIGQPASRLDVPPKVDGSAVYPMDVTRPGMVHAAVMACPVAGGKLASVDASAVQAMPGVIAVIPLAERDAGKSVGKLSAAVAVVANSWWQANAALAKLPVKWKSGEHGKQDSASVDAAAQKLLEGTLPQKDDVKGDAASVLKTAGKTIAADYHRPYEFAAPMSPPAAVADVGKDRVDLWVFTKDSGAELLRAATFLDRDPGSVYVHPVFQGGSFGSGFRLDLPLQALVLSAQLGKPVKVIWSREEDMRRAATRPAVWAKFEAALGEDGYPAAVRVRAVAQKANGGFLSRGWKDTGYKFENLRIESGPVSSPLRVGPNRAPGYNANSFMMEQFVDEMALAGGKDPLAWRIHMSEGNERWQRVLRRLAQELGSAPALPKGQGRGFAAVEIHDTAVACCADVSVTQAGALSVRKLTLVVNPGYVLNPQMAEDQVKGAVAWELGYVLRGGLGIRKGAIEQVNFDSYPPLRFSEMPEVAVIFDLSQDGWWGGMAEVGVPVVGPAVANAVFNAVGVRCRQTPFKQFDLSWNA